MAYNGYAIDQYLDAEAVTRRLDKLIKKPVYTIKKQYLREYEEEYFNKRCQKSKEMIEEAKKVIPGGVQHNLAFNYPFPIVITKAEGAKLYDLDGNWYYDLLQAGGPTILGSNPPAVREQVIELLNTCGPSTGLFHEYEYKLAKRFPDGAVCGNAADAGLRHGGLHGGGPDRQAENEKEKYSEDGRRLPRLVRPAGLRYAGAGHKGPHVQGRAGLRVKHTDEFFPNDLEDLERKLKRHQLDGGTAAVFIEPVGPESGTRPVSKEFIKGAERLAHKYGALLVFDEVVTGFRIGPGGAQGFFGVDPDLTVFGKIVAGGYPGAGGVGGHRDCMIHLGAGLDSSGKKVSKAMCGGTLAATPISCVAGYYTLCEIERTNACEQAGRMGDRLAKGLQRSVRKHRLPFVVFNQGSICHLDNVGTMHFVVNWKKPWTIPHVLKETGIRQKEMEHMGAAYMAEGLITLAGSRLYTSAAYNEGMIDDVIARFDRVFAKCGRLEG